MIQYELAGMDLGEVRFAISPLNEVALSLRTWRDPGRYPLHLPWLHATESARAKLDSELLLALTNDRLWTPDFLTPRPWSPLARFADELEMVRQVPARVMRKDLGEIHPDSMPTVLAGRADRVRQRLGAALEAYWETCFVRWWPRMRAVLEADIVHRAHVTAKHGLAAMFEDLSNRIELVDNVVQVRLTTTTDVNYRRTTAGVGLTLVPTLFSLNASAPIAPEEPPVVWYGARGVGTVWEANSPATDAALVGLIGKVRARLLTVLDEPASSTELAIRLGVTPTAVNQHLRAMKAARLLISARHGRSVLYLRSELGDLLVADG